MLAQYYKLRPDVFIQRAPGKLRLKRQSENYIVSLNDNFIDIVLDFFEQADGKKSLEQLLSNYKGNIKTSLDKMSRYLVSKNLAFFQSSQQKIRDDKLEMVETYLSQHCTDSLSAYEAFACQKFLLITSDIQLFSLVRTMAGYGARDIRFVNVNKTPSITSAQISKGFFSNQKASGAQISEVALSDEKVLRECDVLVITDRALLAQVRAYLDEIPGMPKPKIYWSDLNADHVVLSKRDSEPNLTIGTPTRTRQLIAGAVIGSILFDDLSGVRPLDDTKYLYYGLDAHGPVETAVHCSLSAIDKLKPAEDAGFDLLQNLEYLIKQPLFPIKASARVLHAVDHLNIQAIQVVNPSGEPNILETYYGIGFDQNQARRDALEHFVLIRRAWFTGDFQGPMLGERLQAFDVAQQDFCNPEQSELPFTARIDRQSEFLKFCINKVFGGQLSIRRVDSNRHSFLVTSLGEQQVCCAIHGDESKALQSLLLRLYLNLWLAQHHPNVVRISQMGAPSLFEVQEMAHE